MPAPKENKYHLLQRAVGRKRIIEDPEAFEKAVQDYIIYCHENNHVLTITGMALYLGFACRQALFDYERNEAFRDVVKKARAAVEAYCEARAHGNTPAGAIFILKNFGWKDTVHNVNKDINVTFGDPE